MEIPDLVNIILIMVPLHHYLFNPLPPDLESLLGVVAVLPCLRVLGLRTKALDHAHELRDEVCDPIGVL